MPRKCDSDALLVIANIFRQAPKSGLHMDCDDPHAALRRFTYLSAPATALIEAVRRGDPAPLVNEIAGRLRRAVFTLDLDDATRREARWASHESSRNREGGGHGDSKS